ncbi:MAG: hypothetical protein IKT03_01660 [Muribaculaceae bacterium]|nr:hypothetical protein [Muribaculaceae bacterium]
MENNLCPQCKRIINDTDAEVCPICGCEIDFNKNERKKRLKSNLPEIIMELEKCPMCGVKREKGDGVCSNCGFTYVPVGFKYKKDPYTGEGKDEINRLFDKQREELLKTDKTMAFIVGPIVWCVFLAILIYQLSFNLILSLLLPIIPSIILGVYLYKHWNIPYNNEMNELAKREKDYWRIQQEWKKQSNQKEKEKYGKFKKMKIKKRYNGSYINENSKEIVFYYEKGLIKYNNKYIETKKIIDCSFDDEGGGNVISIGKVKNNTASAIGRALVGGVIAGPTGAVIGGLTSKKNVEQVENVRHEYVVNITINDFDNPLLKLEFGDNISNAREVFSMIQVLLNSGN